MMGSKRERDEADRSDCGPQQVVAGDEEERLNGLGEKEF
jgi:hypothetical protein